MKIMLLIALKALGLSSDTFCTTHNRQSAPTSLNTYPFWISLYDYYHISIYLSPVPFWFQWRFTQKKKPEISIRALSTLLNRHYTFDGILFSHTFPHYSSNRLYIEKKSEALEKVRCSYK